jgi:hypothetical protein
VIDQTRDAYFQNVLPGAIGRATRSAADMWDYQSACAAGKAERYRWATDEQWADYKTSNITDGKAFLTLHPDRTAYIEAAAERERNIARAIPDGHFVVSWHHSEALAAKAAANPNHVNSGRFYIARVVIAKVHGTRKPKA